MKTVGKRFDDLMEVFKTVSDSEKIIGSKKPLKSAYIKVEYVTKMTV